MENFPLRYFPQNFSFKVESCLKKKQIIHSKPLRAITYRK